MNSKALTSAQLSWMIISALMIVGALIFFQPFLAVICIAGLMAYLFLPLYRTINRKLPATVAAVSTLIIAILSVVIPLIIVAVIALSQGVILANDLAALANQPGSPLYHSSAPIVDTVNAALAPFTGSQPIVTVEATQSFFKDVLPGPLKGSVDFVIGLAGSIPTLITSVIVFGFLFNTFLVYAPSIKKTAQALSPFDGSVNKLFGERSGSIIKASLLGQFFLSFLMAVASALLLFMLDLQRYFVFFVIIFTLLGMIPLGSGIIMIPIAIGAMLMGQVVPGAIILALYILVVCNIDNFLRPYFIPKKAKLLPAVTTLATFCGLYYFGLLGVVYGPLIAIALTTTLEAYLQYKDGMKKSKQAT